MTCGNVGTNLRKSSEDFRIEVVSCDRDTSETISYTNGSDFSLYLTKGLDFE